MKYFYIFFLPAVQKLDEYLNLFKKSKGNEDSNQNFQFKLKSKENTKFFEFHLKALKYLMLLKNWLKPQKLSQEAAKITQTL